MALCTFQREKVLGYFTDILLYNANFYYAHAHSVYTATSKKLNIFVIVQHKIASKGTL